MSLSTYTDIQGAISDWLARDDLAARLEDFITLAEAKMRKVLKGSDLDTTMTVTFTQDVDENPVTTYTLPADFSAIRAAYYYDGAAKITVDYRTPAQFSAESAGYHGRPRIYTIIDQDIVLDGSPPLDQILTITYTAVFVGLSEQQQTNWVLTNFPDLYLFGALAEASGYDRNFDAEGKWLTRFNAGLKEMDTYLEDRRFAGEPLVVRST